MTVLAMSVLFATVVLDVLGQVCFKLGLQDSSNPRPPVWVRVATTPVIWLGLVTYAVEIVAWLFVLSRVPLSVAFPVAGCSYGGVTLAGHRLLGEAISLRRGFGTILIATGAAIVSATA